MLLTITVEYYLDQTSHEYFLLDNSGDELPMIGTTKEQKLGNIRF